MDGDSGMYCVFFEGQRQFVVIRVCQNETTCRLLKRRFSRSSLDSKDSFAQNFIQHFVVLGQSRLVFVDQRDFTWNRRHIDSLEDLVAGLDTKGVFHVRWQSEDTGPLLGNRGRILQPAFVIGLDKRRIAPIQVRGLVQLLKSVFHGNFFVFIWARFGRIL